MVWRNGGCGSQDPWKDWWDWSPTTWKDLAGWSGPGRLRILLLNWQLRNTHLVYRNLGLEGSVHTGERYEGTAQGD